LVPRRGIKIWRESESGKGEPDNGWIRWTRRTNRAMKGAGKKEIGKR